MGWIRNYFRRSVRARPFPAAWREALAEHAPFYARIPGPAKAKFEADLMVFENEKSFVAAGGFEITEEVRVVISAAAVRLVLFLDVDCFDRMREIVVYPAAYKHPDRDGVILGEVSGWNTVVLSWADVLAGLANPRDGRDTASHEFAHVLDRATGAFNGTPTLRAREDYAPWGRVLSDHYLRLRSKDRNARKVIRDYGATNEAEFFAVATEVFFERPRLMQRKAPDLYEELERFYGSSPEFEPIKDPASRGKGSPA